MSEHTILIVDDDRMTRQMLRQIVEDHGFTALEVVSGETMLQTLAEHHVDAILLDLYLSDGYGIDFIASTKELTTAPIIVVSGTEDEELITACLEQGAKGFLAKPFIPDVLVAKLEKLIKQSLLELS